MIHHDIRLNKMPVKSLSPSFLSLFKSELLENSNKKRFGADHRGAPHEEIAIHIMSFARSGLLF